ESLFDLAPSQNSVPVSRHFSSYAGWANLCPHSCGAAVQISSSPRVTDGADAAAPFWRTAPLIVRWVDLKDRVLAMRRLARAVGLRRAGKQDGSGHPYRKDLYRKGLVVEIGCVSTQVIRVSSQIPECRFPSEGDGKAILPHVVERQTVTLLGRCFHSV